MGRDLSLTLSPPVRCCCAHRQNNQPLQTHPPQNSENSIECGEAESYQIRVSPLAR